MKENINMKMSVSRDNAGYWLCNFLQMQESFRHGLSPCNSVSQKNKKIIIKLLSLASRTEILKYFVIMSLMSMYVLNCSLGESSWTSRRF